MTRPTVTLYTKPGCHLCEAVEQVIAQVARRRPLNVVLRNILDDAFDFERYQYEIPVVLLDGVEIARYRLTAGELEAAIERLSGRSAGTSGLSE
jgi:glutaredoxin